MRRTCRARDGGRFASPPREKCRLRSERYAEQVGVVGSRQVFVVVAGHVGGQRNVERRAKARALARERVFFQCVRKKIGVATFHLAALRCAVKVRALVRGQCIVNVFSTYERHSAIGRAVCGGSRVKGAEVDVFGADEEFLESILTQYYQSGAEVPEQVLLPKLIEDLEVRENILAEKRKAKVKIIFPKVGSKSRLIALAEANAKENFSARFNSSNVADKILSELAKELDLEEIPRIIECADISHFQGKSTVGSVVSFKDAFPDKTRDRHFILSN